MADRVVPRPWPTTPIEPLRWEVNEFVLVDSQRHGGSQYSVISRWPVARSLSE